MYYQRVLCFSFVSMMWLSCDQTYSAILAWRSVITVQLCMMATASPPPRLGGFSTTFVKCGRCGRCGRNNHSLFAIAISLKLNSRKKTFSDDHLMVLASGYSRLALASWLRGTVACTLLSMPCQPHALPGICAVSGIPSDAVELSILKLKAQLFLMRAARLGDYHIVSEVNICVLCIRCGGGGYN